jgi:hypothetical protein
VGGRDEGEPCCELFNLFSGVQISISKRSLSWSFICKRQRYGNMQVLNVFEEEICLVEIPKFDELSQSSYG